MAQFDYYSRIDAAGYWLDCQAEVLDTIDTHFAVPLLPIDFAPRIFRQLNPVFVVDGQQFVMFTQQAGPVPKAELQHPVGSLAGFHYVIMNAFDFLITGV